MDVINLILIVSFLALLSLFLFLAFRFRDKFWRLYGLMLPFLLGGIFLFNLISFGFINRPYFNWAYLGVLQQLPSNELVDLYATSGTPIKPRWIYAVIENYYQGQSLSIPRDVLESLDLPLESIQDQAQLSDVKIIEGDWNLSEDDLELILDLEPGKVQTQILDEKGNVTREAGDTYYFVVDPADPLSPLVLLRFEDQLFFLPESILQELEGES